MESPKANEKEEHTMIKIDNFGTQDLLVEGERSHSQAYVNSLSSWEMDTLTALCDTFLPSIDVSNVTTNDSVVKFYNTSASMAGTPERVR